MSPNFKKGGELQSDECDSQAHYAANESCTIELATDQSPAIKVEEFDTEKGFDILTVNDVEFSGSGDDVEALQGMVPKGTMTWQTDKGFSRAGWKLCPMDPRETMTYVGAYVVPHDDVMGASS